MDNPIELCYWYGTDGFPAFRPVCDKGRRASLKCHQVRHDCPDYRKSNIPKGSRFEKDSRK